MLTPIGVDPGFGNFKAAVALPPQERVAIVPSVVGVGETGLGLLSLGELGQRHRRREPDRVSFAGVTYLVGEHVARFARPIQRLDFLRLSDGPELRALLYATLGRLLGAGEHRVALMVGLPVAVLADPDQARTTLRTLRAWLVGEHRCTVNETPVALHVADVRAMAQPAGAFFAWGLDRQGQWARSKADLQAPVGVCDVGFNTVDLFAVAGGDVVARFVGGDTAGIRRAAEVLGRAVQAAYGVDLALHEADALLREKPPRLCTAQGEVDLRPLVAQALDTTAAAVVTFIEQRWGHGRQFAHLLFTGGGAETLRDALLRHYPHGQVLPDPVAANAVGLARYAVRVFGPGDGTGRGQDR